MGNESQCVAAAVDQPDCDRRSHDHPEARSPLHSACRARGLPQLSTDGRLRYETAINMYTRRKG
jgi:hypothetical protein